MVSVKAYLVFLFALKFFLDFLSPFRELNFVVFNAFCAFFVFFKWELFSAVRLRECLYLVLFFLLCTLWLFVGGEVKYYIKFISAILIYLVVRVAVLGLNYRDLERVCYSLLVLFLLFMLANVALSFVKASPFDRQFYNFEHANLMGSYILLSLVFVAILAVINGGRLVDKVLVAGMALFTTSTGAFLSSLVVFVRVKRVTFGVAFSGLIFIFFIVAGLYYFTQVVSPELFVKIFGPLSLLLNGGGGELAALSKYRLPLQELGEEYQSSLVWRFYAYLIFWDFIVDQPFLSLLVGNGFWGFSEVWDGIAPHNDFLLILIDFGLIGFLLFLWLFFKMVLWGFKSEPVIIPVLVVLCLRLMFENNIYSYYVFSGLVMNATFFYCVRRKVRGA